MGQAWATLATTLQISAQRGDSPSARFNVTRTPSLRSGDDNMIVFATASRAPLSTGRRPASSASIAELMQRALCATKAPGWGPASGDLAKGEPDHRGDRRRPPARGARLAPWAVKKIERFIDDNLESSLRLETMASVARLSCSHFARACKNTFGLTPSKLVLRRRIERAVRLMREQTHLSEVAAACGFADQAHFSRLFRQTIGTPPGQWRRENLPPPSTKRPFRTPSKPEGLAPKCAHR